VNAINPIRILLTIRQGKIGGGESHVLDLIFHLDKSKFEPVVLSFTDGPMVTRLTEWGITTHVIPTENAFDIRVWKKVKILLKRERVRLVHAHGTRANSNVYWAAKQLSLPLIYTVHGWSFHPDQNVFVRILREAGERFLTNRALLTICVSNSNYNDGRNRINLKRAIIINYGIDLKKFNPFKEYRSLKKELGIPNEQTLVGYLVRITIQKDPHTFIKAISEVVKKTKSIRFLIIGNGDLKESTVSLAKELNVENYIIFQDFRQDIPNVLSGIDIYCLPSLWEGLPIGLLEAMAMKKAIIATPVDGTKEAIQNDHSGLLVPHQSPSKLAEAILYLHENKNRLSQFGEQARNTIQERFEVKRMVAEVESTYFKVLNSEIIEHKKVQSNTIKRKRIGIEAQRLFREKKHGLEIVALEIIRHLQKIDKENEYVIFVREDKDRTCIQETFNFKIREIKASSFPEWEQIKLPRAIREEKIDLLHCTANTAPLFTSVPIILTLHDIIFAEKTNLTGNHYQNFGNLYRKLLLPRVGKKVKQILTVSQSERTTIINHMKVDSKKVTVLYNAVDNSFLRLSKQEIEPIRKKYNLPNEFILFFGNSAPKKNSIGTLKGYVEYCKIHKNAIPLVVAGAFENEIKEEVYDLELSSEIKQKIITIGYIPFNEQPAMYNLANLFLYTSKRESFGMPILESMACGTPVITSLTSSMPEIAGGAAHLVNPHDVSSIAQGILKVMSDVGYRELLIENGLERVKFFSWENTVKELLNIYNETLSNQ
jgi:glycosyltransferase involved in cell wall biosynthesis